MATLIIILAIIGIPAFYAIRQWRKIYRQRQKQLNLAAAYERMLVQQRLCVDRYAIIGNSVIALDCKNKRLAVVDQRYDETRQQCIRLRNVGDTKVVEQRDANRNICRIDVQLRIEGTNVVHSICFFDAVHDKIIELPHMAKQANYWKHQVDLHKSPGWFHRSAPS